MKIKKPGEAEKKSSLDKPPYPAVNLVSDFVCDLHDSAKVKLNLACLLIRTQKYLPCDIPVLQQNLHTRPPSFQLRLSHIFSFEIRERDLESAGVGECDIDAPVNMDMANLQTLSASNRPDHPLTPS